MTWHFRDFEKSADRLGAAVIKLFHLAALFVIGATVVWSGWQAYLDIMAKGHATLDDILLLFIYLELAAMVGIYFKTNRMPVRFLIYVAITALTRLMISIINVSHKATMEIIIISSAVLILAIAELILRFGSARLPLRTGLEEMSDFLPDERKNS